MSASHPSGSPAEEVRRKARRKEAAGSRERRSVWFGLGMFGLVGWAVAIPTLAGVGLGAWLDRVAPVPGFSWTLALLLAGVVLGAANAWWWVKRESRND
ncbi:AtpZ/AtpI family protein [Limibaculum sp. FT325]|uniref:AtpZ/AtpI family protein n=1 Tax=Thermohalobaculum sediminis TaxID=2939436 RepID=UPI0020BFD1EC|nr:AtpZ/AtpI family protein [Limibaculum sediminis]MCL5776224.1 AtpZ/AtpI family protein [Limibaculum sediminis]